MTPDAQPSTSVVGLHPDTVDTLCEAIVEHDRWLERKPYHPLDTPTKIMLWEDDVLWRWRVQEDLNRWA